VSLCMRSMRIPGKDGETISWGDEGWDGRVAQDRGACQHLASIVLAVLRIQLSMQGERVAMAKTSAVPN
jgi:hypothetical protein